MLEDLIELLARFAELPGSTELLAILIDNSPLGKPMTSSDVLIRSISN
jgi:hypothetical protein